MYIFVGFVHVLVIVTNNLRLFSYNSLRSATRDFHVSNRIGGGGYGVVHKVRSFKLFLRFS